jgi:hypothetical protein
VLFFQVHAGEVTGYELWQLEERNVEDSFLELQKAIGVAVTAVERVTRENRDNSREIFALIQGAINDQKIGITIRKGMKTLKGVADAAKIVKLLSFGS